MVYLFDIPAFFILLRETLECTIILSVLLGFLDKLLPPNPSDPVNQNLRRKFKRQIWAGTIAGLMVSIIIGVVFIVVFYTVAHNLWEESEPVWEGVFSLLASIVITLMALSMVRVAQWKKKWETKLREATENHLDKHKSGQKWALFLLPFTVVTREALESVVFIAGIGFEQPATGLPIPVITGILTGLLIGYIIYLGSHKVTLTVFFNTMTTLLFFISAGLFSTSIHEFQEATETEEVVIWKVECCNPETNEGWGIAKTIFGWRQEATVGTTVGYFVYWGVVLAVLFYMFIRARKRDAGNAVINSTSINNDDEKSAEVVKEEKS
ncbi:8288_t:CDS:2 [Ambispora gerdemannii]|uniref:8288_t:CDS:1 n=1 Tax=Ambispora gerdemannii TaxID=144530 RepID=A0A9N9CEZ0_9GLOM|nr:8288_t:CDS:2 [Ambispora gerdemannii]